jgi:hypothetical protein
VPERAGFAIPKPFLKAGFSVMSFQLVGGCFTTRVL